MLFGALTRDPFYGFLIDCCINFPAAEHIKGFYLATGSIHYSELVITETSHSHPPPPSQTLRCSSFYTTSPTTLSLHIEVTVNSVTNDAYEILSYTCMILLKLLSSIETNLPRLPFLLDTILAEL